MFSVYLLTLWRVQNLNEANNSSQLLSTVQKMKLKYDEGPRQRSQSLNKNQTKSPKTPECSAIDKFYHFFSKQESVALSLETLCPRATPHPLTYLHHGGTIEASTLVWWKLTTSNVSKLFGSMSCLGRRYNTFRAWQSKIKQVDLSCVVSLCFSGLQLSFQKMTLV